ncbi:MAG: PspC domain-containing protein [Bacteroidetes bacterium]|jgi:phage shock protein C|nr:PspC domain-containing protein [Bacteroidota bacterium]MBT6688089.1 PspC domain-containing protein [Bacteroidota bacterium]MBT7144522.1 PspC domain-containing protein [Bacteroidota bacterium]MBT7490341.1 PspC domain-containing protein [Bacteroidota bacterium]
MSTYRKLIRSNNRIIGGVCGGIANYLKIDPTIIRIVYIVLSIISIAFPGIIVYILLWILMPDEDDIF